MKRNPKTIFRAEFTDKEGVVNKLHFTIHDVLKYIGEVELGKEVYVSNIEQGVDVDENGNLTYRSILEDD